MCKTLVYTSDFDTSFVVVFVFVLLILSLSLSLV